MNGGVLYWTVCTSVQYEVLVTTLHTTKQHLHIRLNVITVQEDGFIANDTFHIKWTKLKDQVKHSIADEYVNHLQK